METTSGFKGLGFWIVRFGVSGLGVQEVRVQGLGF